MKFLAMHITNRKLTFDIFNVRNVHNIFMEHGKIYHFDPCNAFLAIATNIPQWPKTGFVLQGHKCSSW